MPRTVVYFSPSVSLYGARVALLQLVTHLDPRRYRPVVVCLAEGPLTDALRARGVRTAVIGIHPWRKPKTWWRIPGNTLRIARLLRQTRAELLHANDFWAMPWILAGRAAARSAAPVVCHVRNPVGPRRVREYGLARAERIVTISRALEEEFLHWPGAMRRRRVETIPDGIDFDRLAATDDGRDVRQAFGIPPEAPLLLQVGHLTPRKDQALLLGAAAALPEALRPHVVLLGGEKPQEADYARALRARAAEADLAGRVHFAGFAEAVGAYYRAADVLALPSREEGLGLVSLEAMHYETPVVASRVGGIPEVVRDGETGLLHPPGDADALAHALRTLLERPARRREFGAAGRRRAHAEFSLARHVEHVQGLYDRLLS
jgi:glycosyltransferase involved in cell wall biosynthesis